MSVLDQMAERFRIKVIKKSDDDRNSLEGEPFISPRNPLHDGTEIDGEKRPYAIVGVQRADYIKATFPSYLVSDPFIPGVDDVKKKVTSDVEDEPKPYICPECGKGFTSNLALVGHMKAHR